MLLKRPIICCLLSALVLIPQLNAQESQWHSLGQIPSGTKIQVVENSLRSTTGKFVSRSETELTLSVDGKQVVIPRDRIHRVSIAGKHRKRHVLIGLAIGAGIGAGIGIATNQVLHDAKIIPIEASVLGGVGAGVGAIVPANEKVYTAEGPPSRPEKSSGPGSE